MPSPGNAIGSDSWEHRRKRDQRHFAVIGLLLTTCLLIFMAPVTVMWYITLYYAPETYEARVKATMANVVTDTTLFLKFLIDPFIYAWRLPKFRQAVKAIFSRRSASTTEALTVVHFNKLHASINQGNLNSKNQTEAKKESYKNSTHFNDIC